MGDDETDEKRSSGMHNHHKEKEGKHHFNNEKALKLKSSQET